MATKRKVLAATNIIHNGETLGVGDPIPQDKFTEQQLIRLYERGAVRIVEVEIPDPAPTPVKKSEPEKKNDPKQATPAKITPTKVEPTK